MDAGKNSISEANMWDRAERSMQRWLRVEKVVSYFAADLFRSGMGCLALWLALLILTDDLATNTVALMVLLVGLLQIVTHMLALACSIIQPTSPWTATRT